MDRPPSGPHLTSDVCCVQGGPARSDGLCARKTANAPVADLCSSDFSSYIFQNCLPVPGSGSGSGMSCGREACVASARGTCSPWTSGSSSPWSPCREHHGAPVLAASHSGSVSGSETWTHRMSSHCRSSCEAQHRQACDYLPAPGKCPPVPESPQQHLPPLRRSRPRRGPRVALLTAPAPAPAPSALWQAEDR